jgi:hypothetical protein
MSLAVVFKGPEGLVLAADSRVTLTAVSQAGEIPGLPGGAAQILPTYFDNATKLLGLANHPNVGIVTYGQGAISQPQPRTAHGFIPEFERHLEQHLAKQKTKKPLAVKTAAAELGRFFSQQWKKAGMPNDAEPMVFLVAGFDDGEAYGKVFEVSVPDAPKPIEQSPGGFGLSWGGQTYLAERLLGGVAPMAVELARDELNLSDQQVDALSARWASRLGLSIPYGLLPLQDCIDLATFLVEMTATVMTWTIGIRGVGGEIDVAAITRTEHFQPVQTKAIHPRSAGARKG